LRKVIAIDDQVPGLITEQDRGVDCETGLTAKSLIQLCAALLHSTPEVEHEIMNVGVSLLLRLHSFGHV
jgi:hypothetical protein